MIRILLFFTVFIAFVQVVNAVNCDDSDNTWINDCETNSIQSCEINITASKNNITCVNNSGAAMCRLNSTKILACKLNACAADENSSCQCRTGYHVDNNACTVNTYTVIYSNNDTNAAGNAPPDHTCTYNTSCNSAEVAQNNFTNSGKSFKEWCTESNGTGTCYNPGATLSTTLTTSNGVTITLYARWEDCDNSEGANGWGSNCTVISCSAGYYLANNDTTCPGTTTSCCKACTTSGEYCPGGGQTSETACPKGYYCPGGVISSRPSDCTPADNGYDGRCKCPVGKTSDEGQKTLEGVSGESGQKGCYIKGGDSATCGTNGEHCTKFCDKVGCFYLPVNVYY